MKIRPKNMTYGELAEFTTLHMFLVWMRDQSTPVPEVGADSDSLLFRYLEYKRREQAEYTAQLAKAKRENLRGVRR